MEKLKTNKQKKIAWEPGCWLAETKNEQWVKSDKMFL